MEKVGGRILQELRADNINFLCKLNIIILALANIEDV